MFVNFVKAKERYAICKDCDKFTPLTKICKECGCFMPAKTALSIAYCPLLKWNKETATQDTKDYKLDE